MADGDLYLSDSPNVDTGLVEKDGSLHRTVLTAVPEGTLQLSDSANVSTGYVTDSDGKKHKVNLVAEVEGSLELSDNPSADTGYVTDGDGKKHKVKLTASLHGGGGSTPVIDELNVTPSTSAQVITAPSGTDGYSPVNVAAVTSSIDANIVAGNIKKDVQILGVTGSYEGVAPSGTKTITTNGTHDVAGYANADVQVPTTAPAHYIEKIANADGKLLNSPDIINLNGVTDIGDYVLYYCYAYIGFPSNTSVDMSSLTIINGFRACSNMFQNCTGITSVDLSSLTKVNAESACNSMFNSCTSLTTADLSLLEYISRDYACQAMFKGCTSLSNVNLSSLIAVQASGSCTDMFNGCTSLTSINLSSLSNITGGRACSNMFQGCTNLTTVNLSSLTKITNMYGCLNMFKGCTSLTTLSFPALNSTSFIGSGASYTNQFSGLVSGVTGCTIHFPSNLDPAGGSTVISSLSDYPNFGGTNTVLAFDLPATE